MLFADATVIQVDTASLVTAAGVIAGGITAGLGLLGRIASTYLTARDAKIAILEVRVGELVATVSKDLAEVRAAERTVMGRLVEALQESAAVHATNAANTATNTAAISSLTTELRQARSPAK